MCGYYDVCTNKEKDNTCLVHGGGPEYECYEGRMCPNKPTHPACIGGDCSNCNPASLA